MSKVIVGVLRGGPSSEYDISLKTGQAVLSHLPEGYIPRDILVTKDGIWHIDGVETTPAAAAKGVHVIFNAMHGQYGEDGKVQQILEHLRVPYTGSGPLSSALAMNKVLTKEQFRLHGIRTPHALILEDGDPEELARMVFRKMAPLWVVKPVAAGSSLGATLVRHPKELPDAIHHAREYGPQVLVEEYVRGKEVTCGVVDHFRNTRHYPLFPIEIIPPKENLFFDYASKYNGTTGEHCPPLTLRPVEKKAIQDMAVRIHQILHLRHYSRSDFIVSSRGIYALEANTLPGMTSESLMPKALAAIGTKYHDFLRHIIDLALAGV